MNLNEVADQVKTLGTAWEQFKQVNDQRLAEIEKKGSSDPLLKDQLDKINAALDETKQKLDQQETAIARAGKGGEQNGEKESTELVEHKKAFNTFLRKGVDAGLADLESKALSVGSDPDGGYLVTPAMSSRIVKKIYETSPIRQVAAVETISTDSLEMLVDNGEIGNGWTGETSARSDTDTPQLGKKFIVVHEMYAQPKATQKLIDDSAINIEQWLADKISEKFARTENTAFVSGDGVAKPRGFLTYTAGTSWGQIEQVASGVSSVFTADDLIKLFYALKSEYAAGASFLMKRATIQATRLMKDATGNYIWAPSFDSARPDTLLGKPLIAADDMPTPGSNSLSVAFGDFRQGYQIVDRIGIRVLRDPYTDKPFVKFYATKRVGGDVVNFEAIKLLKLGA